MAERLRLADLLGGLSMLDDLGFGLPPGTAVRTSHIAAALARRADLGDDDVRDAFYTGLLLHVGCVAVAHESAAAFGDDLALNRAVARSNLADPNDVEATLLPELTREMAPAVAARARAFARSREVYDWGRRTDIGVCEVARDTARRLGLPHSTQRALYHVFESWVGGGAPTRLKGDSIPVASRVARVAMDAALFGQLGGVEAAVAAVRARAGVILDPAMVATFVAHARSLVAEADRVIPATGCSRSNRRRPSSVTVLSGLPWRRRSATWSTSRCRVCMGTPPRSPGWRWGLLAACASPMPRSNT